MSTEPHSEISPIDRAAAACGSLVALAEKVGVAASAPSMWKSRGGVPPVHCAAVEQATEGAVRRWDLRPADWHRIWPELINAAGAPAITEESRDVA